MDYKEYLLLNYLSQFDEPVKISESNAPHEIKTNFQFFGLDKHQFPDSIHVRLFELSKFKLVKSPYAGMWQITDIGRIELKKYEDALPKPSFASLMDKAAKFITLPEYKDKGLSEKLLSEKLNIDRDTIEAIGNRLKDRKFIDTASAGAGQGLAYFVNKSLHAFLLETSFEQERQSKQFTPAITNSFNSTTTTHGENSPIAGHNLKQNINPEPEKKSFLEKIIDDIRNAIVSHCVVAAITLASGLLIGKSCNQSANPIKSQLPPQSNITVSQNRDTAA